MAEEMAIARGICGYNFGVSVSSRADDAIAPTDGTDCPPFDSIKHLLTNRPLIGPAPQIDRHGRLDPST